MTKKTIRSVLYYGALASISTLMTLLILSGIAYIVLNIELPDVRVLRDVHLQVPLRIYTEDHQLISEFGQKKRQPVTIDQIPKPLIHAVLAVEDARFYDHPGVDFIGLARATVAVIHSGRKVQGASTLTMQVARNFFLSKKKSYTRKIKEILLALKIDHTFSKDKILALYLNKIYFGHRAYGVASAAEVYYGKTLAALTLPEMAMIAGLPQAPSRNNPLTRPTQALERRNHVLKRMLEVGYIDQRTYANAITQPITAALHDNPITVKAPYVAEMVRQAIVNQYGDQAYERGLTVTTTLRANRQTAATAALQNGLQAYSQRHGYRGPIMHLTPADQHNSASWPQLLSTIAPRAQLNPAIITHVDDQSATAFVNGSSITLAWPALAWARPALPDGQVGPFPKSAHQVLKAGDVVWLSHTSTQWQLAQSPLIQGAIVMLSPTDGAIEALSGGYDFSLSAFNRATQARRQPGSNFKPFLYSAALAKGYTMASVINDAPIVLQDTGENALWRPNNDTQHFYGPTRLRVGLSHSRNIVSIRLLQQLGLPYVRQYVQRFGFPETSLPQGLSLALGSNLTTPLDIAAGYATFANGGYHIQPYLIERIVDENTQQTLMTASPQHACPACLISPNTSSSNDTVNPNIAPAVITPQNAYLMTKAMQDVIQHGTGRAARALNRSDLAGKTGTTNNKVDAWFSGFNSDIVTTVWVGFDNSQPTQEYGAQAALPIWAAAMRQCLRGQPEHTMPEPPNLVRVRIDPKTGLLARPDQANSFFEVFRRAYQPTRYAPDNKAAGDTDEAHTSNQTTTDDNSEPLF